VCWQKPSRADSQCAKRWRTRRRRILDAQGLGQGQQQLTLPPLHPSRAELGSSPRKYLRVSRGGNCIRTSVTAHASRVRRILLLVLHGRRFPLLDAGLATAARRAPGHRGDRCSTRARPPQRHLLAACPATAATAARRAPGDSCSTRAWRQLLDARLATAARRAPGDSCSTRARRLLRHLLDTGPATAARRAPGNRGEICSTRAWRQLLCSTLLNVSIFTSCCSLLSPLPLLF
jgi:hypothetical protein